MKTRIIILAFLFVGQTAMGQTNIDSLIKKLDNSQADREGDYWGPTMHLRFGPPRALIDIGKPASDKLLMVLDDSTRGIIAHCILSNIWGKEERPTVIYSEQDAIAFYTYNKLNFFVGHEKVYANKGDLQFNKILWREFLMKNDH